MTPSNDPRDAHAISQAAFEQMMQAALAALGAWTTYMAGEDAAAPTRMPVNGEGGASGDRSN